MAISKANRSLFPRIPGSSFARYIQQEQSKFEEKENDLTFEQEHYPWLEQRVRDILEGKRVSLRYKGLLDGRIPQSYPGPAKEGNFWVVEWPGWVGSYAVNSGDVLVRLIKFDSDWTLISREEETDVQMAKQIADKHLRLLKKDLRKSPSLNTSRTKAAPEPKKRKVILEDE